MQLKKKTLENTESKKFINEVKISASDIEWQK